MSNGTTDVRADLRSGLEDRFPKVLDAIDDALEATKNVNQEITYKHCSRRGIYSVQVRDTKAALEAAEFMSTHGFGRPGTAPEAEQERINFTRIINYGGPDVGDVLSIAEGFLDKPQLADFAAALHEVSP